MDDFSNMSDLVEPRKGLVPYHPDAKGLTISDAGMLEVVHEVKIVHQKLFVMVFMILIFISFFTNKHK